MSDFLLSTRPRQPGELTAHLRCFLEAVTAEFQELHWERGSVAIARAAHDPPMLIENGPHLAVLAGLPLIRTSDTGVGFADDELRRAAVGKLLVSSPALAWEQHLDGHYAAFMIHRGSGEGRVVTDTFSFIPVFHATDGSPGSGGSVLGTHSAAVARAAGRTEVDLVSAADIALNLTSTFPYTLYRGVEQLPPGSDRRFGATGWSGPARVYWQPTEERLFGTLRDAAAALREGMKADASAASTGCDRVGLLLSGGEDSRAVLGALPRGVAVRPVIYAEWESREVRVARAAARAYGAELTVGLRTANHYIDGFDVVAAMLGSDHNFMDVHGYGIHERVGLSELPVVFGGLSADSLLKSVYERADRPVEVAEVPGIRRDLLSEVAARRNRFRAWLAGIRPTSAAEWDTLWPFSMRKHGGNLDGNRRLFRSHELYHATACLRVAAAVPTEWKKGRRLYLSAVRPFLAKSWYVPHSEFRFPYFGRIGNGILLPGLAVARAGRALAQGEFGVRHRPWPKWNSVARSESARRKWSEAAIGASPLREIFDLTLQPREIESAVARLPALGRLMLMQLVHTTRLTVQG